MDTRGAHWFKSSYSGGSGTECIEVADLRTEVAVRDSKQPSGAHIAVQRSAWTRFIAAVHLRQF
jgi:hypothetical protein